MVGARSVRAEARLNSDHSDLMVDASQADACAPRTRLCRHERWSTTAGWLRSPPIFFALARVASQPALRTKQ
jgi:hypothetical protein